jgi:glucose-6-phosphate isomerase
MEGMLKLDLSRSLVETQDLNAYKDELEALKKRLWSGKEDFTGWVQLPFSYDKSELKKILSTAEKIRKQCEVFIIIGIGGSYLGSRAAISALADIVASGVEGFVGSGSTSASSAGMGSAP